jgi:hypothetical protein
MRPYGLRRAVVRGGAGHGSVDEDVRHGVDGVDSVDVKKMEKPFLSLAGDPTC